MNLLLNLRTCTALLVAVMEYHVCTIRVDRETIMSWCVVFCFVLLIFMKVSVVYSFRLLPGIKEPFMTKKKMTILYSGYGYAWSELVGCLE